MVVERFKNGDADAVGKRFEQTGRMLPEGVAYHASWIDPERLRCFQIMEAANAELLNEWTRHWDDLVDFEIAAVVTSSEFWTKLNSE